MTEQEELQMLASIIYNYDKFCDNFKSTLKLGAYE